jgi:hypothetical protein
VNGINKGICVCKRYNSRNINYGELLQDSWLIASKPNSERNRAQIEHSSRLDVADASAR